MFYEELKALIPSLEKIKDSRLYSAPVVGNIKFIVGERYCNGFIIRICVNDEILKDCSLSFHQQEGGYSITYDNYSTYNAAATWKSSIADYFLEQYKSCLRHYALPDYDKLLNYSKSICYNNHFNPRFDDSRKFASYFPAAMSSNNIDCSAQYLTELLKHTKYRSWGCYPEKHYLVMMRVKREGNTWYDIRNPLYKIVFDGEHIIIGNSKGCVYFSENPQQLSLSIPALIGVWRKLSNAHTCAEIRKCRKQITKAFELRPKAQEILKKYKFNPFHLFISDGILMFDDGLGHLDFHDPKIKDIEKQFKELREEYNLLKDSPLHMAICHKPQLWEVNNV